MTAATVISGGVGPGSHSYTRIVTATTTAIKAGEGTLHRLTVNKKVASGVITLYDHPSAASGTVIAIITNPATLLDNGQTFEYGIHFKLGLTIVTAQVDDLTVVWD
jgi:hypothetical protein